jgi:hypothetical protein
MFRDYYTAIPTEKVDEIPTNPSPLKARVATIAVASIAVLTGAAYFWLPPALAAFLSRNAEIQILFQSNHTDASLKLAFQLFGVLTILCSVAGIVGFFRNRIAWHALRLPLYAVYLIVGFFLWVTWQACFSILDKQLKVDGFPQNNATIISLWWSIAWPTLAMVAFAAWTHVILRSRSVYAAFTREKGTAMVGDRVLEDIRTHGRDPRNRRSLYLSTLTHFIILILIPYLLSLSFCGPDPYKVPKGSGTDSVEAVAVVKMVKKKQQKKKRSLSLRANSSIIYATPDLDDAQVDQVMEDQTQETYVADNKAGKTGKGGKGGKMGKGGGTEGGWPEGMDDYKIRFIRLEHGGMGWDDGMDESNADINFLRAFAQATGFKKIASKGESHSIALLKKYPKDAFPPFVFLTGNGPIGNVSAADKKILRDYCLNGGMLIADAGSVEFHKSFMPFIRSVFPDKPLIDIADDDMLYQVPYTFPDGAPPFWRLGGTRALGIKHEGRWIAFYHPGDMNGAWKSQGYTDVTPEMREAAMNLGVNLVYYAFNQWDDAVSKAKK